MTALFPAHAAKCVQEVIKEKFDNFTSGARRKHLPGLDTLIFIRLALLLFPGSDFRHTVITPALILSLQILATARPTDRPTFASGIFLATMVAEACQLSHRFTPELINFLTGIFHVSCDSMPAGKYPPPPCKGGKLLVTTQKLAGDIEVSKLKLSEVTSVKGIDDMFRTQCLNSACILTIKLLDLYGSLASIHEIFAPVITTLKCINRDKMHDHVVEKLREIETKFAALPAKKGAVVRPNKPTKMLQMLDPCIDDNFDPERKHSNKGIDQTEVEKQKLRYHVRMEKKGAKKEIRKDMAFLATHKDRALRAIDVERKEKTKRILGNLAEQEGDYQKLQRIGKKKKKF